MRGVDKFKMRMQASGGGLRQERINTVRNLMDSTFKDDPSYYSEVEVLNKHPVNCRIYDFNSPTRRDGIMMCMTEYDHPLLKGDLLFWQDIWWLTTHQQNIHDIYWNGVIERTNHLLKWKDANGTIIERYCKAEDNTKYTTGEKAAGFEILLPDTRRLLRVSYDEDTTKLVEGQRLIIDKRAPRPKVYKITNIDRVSDVYENDGGINGVINIICVADLFNPQTDNAELMIADYYATPVTYGLEPLNFNVTTPLSLNPDDVFQINVLATRNGETCDKCTLLYRSTNEDVATVDSDGLVTAVGIGICEITITYETQTIELFIDVQVAPTLDAHIISIVDADNDLEIIYGDTNEVAIRTYKNGVDDISVTFEYELLDAENVAHIHKVVGNNVIIVAENNPKNINKAFRLRVWNATLGIEDIKEFKVVGFQ